VRVHAALLSALLVTAPAAAADAPAAHQHGAARLEVSLEGRALQIAFEGPADNILGFERAPKNDAQKKTVAEAERKLNQPAQLFTIPAAAGCEPKPARVEMKLPPPGSKETHSEIEAEWRWECAKPEALAYIDVGLFKAFPRLTQLRAVVVTAQGQKKATLRANAARLKIAS
jgi:Protein of unknown function (DUF2796)